jgi:hypothetical protein
MSDLQVVGMDRITGEVVHVEDASLEALHAKSQKRGDGSLICRQCFFGDRTTPGTVVPLVVKGRYRGVRRAHFAHPPGTLPEHGHYPESRWHRVGKQLIAQWAETLPQVAQVRIELWLPERTRRADVMITLMNGTELAVELQQQLLPDPDWLARHRSYLERGIVDVWLWHPRIRAVPWIVLRERMPLWRLDMVNARISVACGIPHLPLHDWHLADEEAVYDLHQPPCPDDKIQWVTQPLAELRDPFDVY